jgi:predicted dehydrogenase
MSIELKIVSSGPKEKQPSRRTFLYQSGVAVAGLATAAQASVYAPRSSRKLRIGIVGGAFGTSFQFHEHPDCVVEAVSDLRPERKEKLMKVYKCAKSYPSLEELVKDPNIDAVGVFTEGPNHVKHVLHCLKHGKHVLSAVPACWATIDEAEALYEGVKKSGLIYMMAETSYFQQFTISVRKFYQEGRFGEIFFCESEYQHDGLEKLYMENGKRTWRYGVAPMHYPTHCTAHLLSVTGERLTDVTCQGWGNDDPILKDNAYHNPFWNASAFFTTDRDHSFRVNVWWKGAHMGCERAQWIGTKMSFYAPNPLGLGAMMVQSRDQLGKDDAGFARSEGLCQAYEQPKWWATDLLPEPLRHDSGHQGSHTFITHEFVQACLEQRKPVVDVHEALAYTVPGIIAHQSALQGGKRLRIPQFKA